MAEDLHVDQGVPSEDNEHQQHVKERYNMGHFSYFICKLADCASPY